MDAFLPAAKPSTSRTSSWRSCSCCCCVRQHFSIIVKATPYKNLYENKVVDPGGKRSCAKFEPIVTNSFAKNGQKRLIFFCNFTFFGLFDLQNDLQIQIWPDPPNIIWGCPIFLFLWFFVGALLMHQIFFLNIFSDLFALLITFLFDFSYFSRFSFFQHSSPCLRSSNRVCSCFSFSLSTCRFICCWFDLGSRNQCSVSGRREIRFWRWKYFYR